jgi:hypothetical protein
VKRSIYKGMNHEACRILESSHIQFPPGFLNAWWFLNSHLNDSFFGELQIDVPGQVITHALQHLEVTLAERLDEQTGTRIRKGIVMR